MVPAVGALLALSAALAAACFVLGPSASPSSDARARPCSERCRRKPTSHSLAAMFVLAALCLTAGIVPGVFIDALAPVTTALVGASMPHQTGVQWLSIVPIAQSRSSYNGLLVFFFMAMSGRARRLRHPSAGVRTGCAAHRPGIAAIPIRIWLMQYTASSFAQPIRRVYGTLVFGAREVGEMPPPGSIGRRG